MSSSCKYGKGRSETTSGNGEKFIDQLSDYQLLYSNTVTWLVENCLRRTPIMSRSRKSDDTNIRRPVTGKHEQLSFLLREDFPHDERQFKL